MARIDNVVPDCNGLGTQSANYCTGVVNDKGTTSNNVTYTRATLTGKGATATKVAKINGKGFEVVQPKPLRKGTATKVTSSLREICNGLRRDQFNLYGIARALLDQGDGSTVSTNTKKGRTQHQVAFTKDDFVFPENVPLVLFLDNDPDDEAIPQVKPHDPEALTRILHEVMPEVGFDQAEVLGVASSGAGRFYNTETDETYRYKRGQHTYMAVLDGSDIPRFGDVVFKRLWLAGHGSIAFASNGNLLVKTIIDKSVFTSQRIDYAAPPHIEDAKRIARDSVPDDYHRPGDYLDTRKLADLTPEQERAYARLVNEAREVAAPQSKVKAKAFKTKKVKELVDKGHDTPEAERLVNFLCSEWEDSGDLYPGHVVHFDKYGPVDIADVLNNWKQYDTAACADPIEGPGYKSGTTTAAFYANKGGKPVINSHAHGGRVYFCHDVIPAAFESDFTTSTDEANEAEAEAEGEHDEPSAGDSLVRARNSARRSAFEGAKRNQAIRRIRNNPAWKDAHASAEEIVDKAYKWIDRFAVGNQYVDKGVPKTITNMHKLNTEYAVVRCDGQPGVVAALHDSLFLSFRALKMELETQIVLSGIDDKGNPKFTAAHTYWTGCSHRRSLNGIVFTNAPTSADKLNLFHGYGVTPIKGECSRILNHIREVICSGNEEAYNYLRRLWAWQFQHVGKQSRVVVILRSDRQQVGKGAIAEKVLHNCWGAHRAGLWVNKRDSVKNRFNAPFKGKSFCGLDEAVFKGDRELSAMIKSIVANDTISIEHKGVDAVPVPNGINMMILTNSRTPISLDEFDARCYPLNVSEHRADDREYFDALYHEIENGGLEAFLYEMLNTDLTDFHPRGSMPKDNEVHREMIRDSRDPADVRNWLEECIATETLCGFENGSDVWEENRLLKSADILAAYRNWAKSLTVRSKTETAPQTFWKTLTECGFVVKRTNTGNLRHIPAFEHIAEVLPSIKICV
jgi:Family of unknown function (DUF5906)